MFWIALAAQISMPALKKGYILGVFTADDVPIRMVPEGAWRRVGVRVTVDAEGKIQSCEIESTSGNPQLDSYTCAIIRKRAKPQPARWSDGTPTYAVIRTVVSYSVNATVPPESGDIELTVNQLPQGLKSPAFAQVMFAVDEKGHPSFCSEEGRIWKPLADKAPELIKIACDQIMKNWVPKPARDLSGKPVRSIQDARIKFIVDRR